MSKEELIEAIAGMTVLELSELVKALEEKFGVSAAAPMAMVAAGPAGAAEADVEEEEQTEFDVMLTGVGDQKIQVIKAVRELTNLGLREAKAVVDEAPSKVLEGVSKEDADAARSVWWRPARRSRSSNCRSAGTNRRGWPHMGSTPFSYVWPSGWCQSSAEGKAAESFFSGMFASQWGQW